MIARRARPPEVLATLALLLVAGCAQGMLNASPSTILNTVILAGEAIGTVAGSGTTTSSSGSRTTSTRARIPRSPAPTAVAANILNDADRYVGVRYTWGGNTPQSGFDCSGFTKYVFAKQGIQLPRTSRDQAHAGRAVAVDFASLRPGDLLLFAGAGEAISHVAIYTGDVVIIHSSTAVGGVGYTDLNTGGDWFIQNVVSARRLLADR